MNERFLPSIDDLPDSMFGKKEFKSIPPYLSLCETFPPYEEDMKKFLNRLMNLTIRTPTKEKMNARPN